MVSTKVIRLANPPNRGSVDVSTFRVDTDELPELQDGQILAKVLALSNDPAQKTWMDTEIDPKRLYMPPIKKDDIVRASGIVEVVESKSSKFEKGQRLVAGNAGWREYAIFGEGEIQELAADIPGQSKWISLGGIGMTGRTAWIGAFKEMNLKPEHTLLVSGAAGAVGSALIQIAKNVVGCKRIVGIAGGQEKCDYVKSLGADACVDYKEKGNLGERLKEALQGEADMFFDNVGGEVLDEALTVIKRFGYVSVCGAISGYHGAVFESKNWREVVYNRITLKGFILIDHPSALPTAGKELAEWVKAGKLNVERETAVDTKFEDIPKTWMRLFSGDNTGKLITVLV